ncbi:phosphate propanoyltransferase [Candidatus Sumerlaeota bacterium]|nr:phosphate propanoyltransferase [Candidatus Sumerlaeota bacterium]
MVPSGAPARDRGAPRGTEAVIRSYGPAAEPKVSAGASSGSLQPEDPGVSPSGRPTVTCNVSNRHIHLTKEDLETLFGKGAELTPRNALMQPFQFAAKETVSLIAGRGRTIESVRILGPLRKYTQVEISRTDGFYLGIRPPVRQSGDIKGSSGGTLVGPKGTLVLKEGIIIADRHIHTPPEAASRFGLVNNQMIKVNVFHTEKPTLMEQVRIRISEEFLFEMHIDNDDANASGVNSGDRLELIF